MKPEQARLTFAAFPADLRAAMKTAAVGYQWRAEDWPLHIEMIQDALRRGADPATLADNYRTPPPADWRRDD